MIDEKIEPETKLKLVALISVRARFETLTQVLHLITWAKERDISLDRLENIMADWISEVEAHYTEILLEEPVFKYFIMPKLAKEVRRIKTGISS
ncbi:MAG: hypothetical protein ACXQTI_03525 [Candidatus Nezhaarchaeales archaeon]